MSRPAMPKRDAYVSKWRITIFYNIICKMNRKNTAKREFGIEVGRMVKNGFKWAQSI